MIRDTLGALALEGWALISLLLFVGLFVGGMAYTMSRRRKKTYDDMANIPFEEEKPCPTKKNKTN